MLRWALLLVATAAAVVAGAATEPHGPPHHGRPCLGGGEHCLLEPDASGDGASQTAKEDYGEVSAQDGATQNVREEEGDGATQNVREEAGGEDGERGDALRDGEGESGARTDAGDDMGGGGDGRGRDGSGEPESDSGGELGESEVQRLR